MKFLLLLAIFFTNNAFAESSPRFSVQQVKAQLVRELKNPKHPVTKWIRMISETSSRMDGRWAGISKDFQLVPAGSTSEVGQEDSLQFLMVFLETSGFHRGSQTDPLLFLFQADLEKNKLVLSNFSFQRFSDQGGLLKRKPGFYDVSPTEDDLSQETRDELVVEMLAAVGNSESIGDFENGQGATISYVLQSMQSRAKQNRVDTQVTCAAKPGVSGVSICGWGYQAPKASETLSFEIYSDNYVNGEHIGKFNEILPGTFHYSKK